MKKQFLEIGKITGTHGVHGGVRIQAWCDGYEFLNGFKTFYLTNDGSNALEKVKIVPTGNVFAAQFKGINTIESAEKLRNSILYINRDDVHAMDGGYFIQDIIGCRVTDANNNTSYGEIRDVSKTGANDVWHIVRDGIEYLIPVIPDVVKQVDIDGGVVYITPLKGIFDDEN